jgi:hypothetical protein
MEHLGWPEGGEIGRALSSELDLHTMELLSRGSGNLQTGEKKGGLAAMEFEWGYVKASQQAMS